MKRSEAAQKRYKPGIKGEIGTFYISFVKHLFFVIITKA